MYTYLVRWETLNGNIRTKRFYDAAEAEAWADRIAKFPGTQWVDVEAI